MIEELKSQTKEKMDLSIEAMKTKFSTIRTGKVSASSVNQIKVDYYGTMTDISQIASVIVPDATTIVISPWEKNLIPEISRAIAEANIGVNPNDDEDGIKLFFPAMTSEQRTASVKVAKTIAEEFKVSIRNVRKESNDKIKKALKDKELTEDESKSAQTNIQSITDDMISKLDVALSVKEKEILTI
jgi:ribosome recycling factor